MIQSGSIVVSAGSIVVSSGSITPEKLDLVNDQWLGFLYYIDQYIVILSICKEYNALYWPVSVLSDTVDTMYHQPDHLKSVNPPRVESLYIYIIVLFFIVSVVSDHLIDQ